MNKTANLIAVAQVLMRNPGGQHYGYPLLTETGIRSGALYPLLYRLLEAGWLQDGWEDPATVQGRPPRRFYTLTATGLAELGALAAQAPRPTTQAVRKTRLAFAAGFLR